MGEVASYLGIHCGDSRDLSFIPDETVDLVVTSPPYNVGIAYGAYEDSKPFDEYLAMLRDVWRECWRVLKAGGRIAVNIAGTDRKPYTPLHAYITLQLIELGFLMRGEVIWNKGSGTNQSTAWGTWQSPVGPVLRDQHEYILIFSKREWSLQHRGETDLTGEEFTEYTRSLWYMNPAQERNAGHPVPYPLELPARLIKLYTFKGDVVLDPFLGSGTTLQAAELLERKWIGVDIDPNYCELARRNLNRTQQRFTFEAT